MDEEDCDFQSPIGQMIKNINTICKKPKIDNQLSEALEIFNKHIIEQQQYLRNGIFKTNFAEAALFLQSCAELYGKKIDLLWDEIIAFLTRLIQYDCEHEKEHGQEVNQDVISKLEERRNKFKRKRRSKKDEEAKKLAEQLLCNNSAVLSDSVPPNPITSDVHVGSHKNTNNNEDIPLPENSEITKIPGWNDIQCLFEQMDERKLPDKNNLLAILKVCAYGRMQFLKEKKLPLDSPYNTFKDEYIIFRKKFFEEATKKWEAVTLETFEDLHKVLTYLAQKEKQKHTKTVVPSSFNEPNQLGQTKNLSIDRYLENSDDDSLFELSFIVDQKDKSDKNNLMVHLEQLSSEIIDNKLRQDSGFYEFNSDDSCSSNNENENTNLYLESSGILNQNTNTDNVVQATLEEETNFCVNVESNIEEDKENQQPVEENFVNKPPDNFDTRSIISDHDYCAEPISIQTLSKRQGKRKSIQEKSSQHHILHVNCFGCKDSSVPEKPLPKIKERIKMLNDKDLMPPPLKIRKLSHKQVIKLLQSVVPAVKENHFERFFSENYQPEQGEGEIHPMNYQSDHDNPVDQDCNENESDENSSDEENDEDMDDPEEDDLHDNEDCHNDEFLSNTNIPNPIDRIRSPSIGIHSDHETDQHGLSQVLSSTTSANNALDNCQQSPIEQTTSNCGAVQNINENTQLIGSAQQTADDSDDTASIFSEHSYCQTTEASAALRNDSGFVDCSPVPEEEQEEENMESLFTRVDNIVGTNNEPVSIDEEYQRILQLLEESQKDMINEQAGRPTEAQRKQHEALELQARVEEWRESITSVLNGLDGQDFDIHEYGSKIMDQIPKNETRSFSNIVEGMTSAEVTRYFISSLQLANTENIEICGIKSGQLSNESFEIKLLGRDRYHEHLIEYQAPSKESLKERIKRLRNEKKQDSLTEDLSPPTKRSKIELHNGRKNSTTTLRTYAPTLDYSEPSTSRECLSSTESTLLYRDSNNNRNRSSENIGHINTLSKSLIDNPKKGKSIMRRSITSHQFSFEGSQAPQALSVQITSPRQLHIPTSLPNWTQPSNSYGDVPDRSDFLADEAMSDNHTLERDFQRLHDMQRRHPNCQLQSTPRNTADILEQASTFTPNLNRRKLFD